MPDCMQREKGHPTSGSVLGRHNKKSKKIQREGHFSKNMESEPGKARINANLCEFPEVL